jgi:predicted ATP-dependent serine protease
MSQALNLGNPTVNLNTNILDIEIPKEMLKATPTGIPQIDLLFEGTGILRTTATFIPGIPGAGKTTFGLTLADKLQSQGVEVVYNAVEESLFQIRRVVNRLNLQHGFSPSYRKTAQEIEQWCELKQAKSPDKQIALFVDSIQDTSFEFEKAGPGRPPGQETASLEAMKYLIAWAKRTYNFVFFISKVTKSGKFKGSNDMLHDIDVVLELDVDTNKKSENYGKRIIRNEKNRFGPSGIEFAYELTGSGISFLD